MSESPPASVPKHTDLEDFRPNQISVCFSILFFFFFFFPTPHDPGAQTPRLRRLFCESSGIGFAHSAAPGPTTHRLRRLSPESSDIVFEHPAASGPKHTDLEYFRPNRPASFFANCSCPIVNDALGKPKVFYLDNSNRAAELEYFPANVLYLDNANRAADLEYFWAQRFQNTQIKQPT